MSKAKRTDIANIDLLLQQKAEQVKSQINTATNSRITIDQQGNFTLPDGTNLGNRMSIVIVDFLSLNLYYDRTYNADNPVPPACYAIGQIISDMKPADDSPVKQADSCAECFHNQFGSRGENAKACKNTRRLAVVLAAQADDPAAPIYELNIPPTGLKSFDGAVNYIATTFKTAPVGVAIDVTTVPGKTSNYYAMVFDVNTIEKNPYAAVCVSRIEEALQMIDRAPDVSQYKPLPAPKTPNRAAPPRGR